MAFTEILPGIHYVGVNDRTTTRFESLWSLPYGVSYNSYLVIDEKVALIDTVEVSFGEQFIDNIRAILKDRPIDYLVVDHMEPDHSGSLLRFLEAYPTAKVVASAKAFPMIQNFFSAVSPERQVTVGEGDTLSLGNHTLRFIAAPMVHWPEVLMTYDETDRLLLTADAFGCFGALNGRLFADEVDFDRDYLDETRRYYTNIVGKYGSQVQTVLKKAAELDIAMLLPLHGFVWRKELGYLLHKYDLWSRYEPEERGVLIAYASVYGNTENAANILACRLSERGVKVQMFDTSVTPTSYILSAAFRYSHLVFAATTYNAGVFITMEELLHDIAAHDLQNRRVVLLENGSWAPASGKGMQKILQPLKEWQQMEDTFTIRSALREDQTMQLERLAATLAADVQAAAPAEEKPEGQHRYVCKVCGYVYEGDSLPEDYKCPLCGAGAEYFKQES